MANIKKYSYFVLLAGMMIYVGCGGSRKEQTEFAPNPFPEVDSTSFNEPQEAPQEKLEVTKEEEPADEVIRFFTVHFDFDQSSLTSEARAILAENGRTLLAHPEIKIRIEGHCDERGTVEYNLALGERRAMAVRNYLINYGVRADRMTVISYGKERPIDPRHTPEAWAQNRRAEFVNLTQ